eukprot:COSAG04_NODE_10167_length_799_cov_1.691429_1_plen_62_part_01
MLSDPGRRGAEVGGSAMEPAAAPPRLREIARHVWPDRERLRGRLPTPSPTSEGDDDPTLSAE